MNCNKCHDTKRVNILEGQGEDYLGVQCPDCTGDRGTMTLHKHVVTSKKVSFIEIQRKQQLDAGTHPVMLTMSKQAWLDADRPETIEVAVRLSKKVGL